MGQGPALWEGLVGVGRGQGRGPASDWHIPPQATISYYQLMHMQTAPLPVHFQMLCESSKLYDPGQQYASHVRQLQRGEEPDVRYDFEPHVPTNAWYLTSPQRWVQPHACGGCGWQGSGAVGGGSPYTCPPPGPQSCVHGKAASTPRTPQDLKLLAAPPRMAAPPRALPARTTGVSVRRGAGRTL